MVKVFQDEVLSPVETDQLLDLEQGVRDFRIQGRVVRGTCSMESDDDLARRGGRRAVDLGTIGTATQRMR